MSEPFNAATLMQIAAVRPDLIPEMHGILTSTDPTELSVAQVPASEWIAPATSSAPPRDALLEAAQALLAAVDDKFNNEEPPLKYTIPYGEVNALREAVNATVMRQTKL